MEEKNKKIVKWAQEDVEKSNNLLNKCMYVCVCLCVCVYVYMYIYICICMYVCMCVRMYVCIFITSVHKTHL